MNSSTFFIVIPTHERPQIVKSTIAYLLAWYKSLNISPHIICVDSSREYDNYLSSLAYVTYVHKPGVTLWAKFKFAFKQINELVQNKNQWILINPDDDLYLSNDVNMILADLEDLNWRAVSPSRYIFISNWVVSKNRKVLTEQWTHHLHIGRSKLNAIERLRNYVDKGVNTTWGFITLKAFHYSSVIADEISKALPTKMQTIVEDILNIESLAYDWYVSDSAHICLRKDDRAYQRDPNWLPSWTIYKSISKKPESCQRLNDYVHHILRATTGLHISFDSSILEKHVLGYQLANSRAYDTGVKFLFASSEFRPKKLQYQCLKVKDRQERFFVIPQQHEDIPYHLYPKACFPLDKNAIDIVCKNEQFILDGNV